MIGFNISWAFTTLKKDLVPLVALLYNSSYIFFLLVSEGPHDHCNTPHSLYQYSFVHLNPFPSPAAVQQLSVSNITCQAKPIIWPSSHGLFTPLQSFLLVPECKDLMLYTFSKVKPD